MPKLTCLNLKYILFFPKFVKPTVKQYCLYFNGCYNGFKMKKGFTLAEILIAIGVLIVVSTGLLLAFIPMQNKNLINETSNKIIASLKETQSKSASNLSDDLGKVKAGIAFTTNSYTEFITSSDFSSRDTTQDFTTDLPDGLEFSEFSLPNDCYTTADCVIFSSQSGTPLASGLVKLKDKSGTKEITISINEQGVISSL